MNRLTRRDLLVQAGAAALLPALATAAEGATLMDAITPFTIAISDAQIADLKERITRTRYPHALTNDWSRGQNVGFMQELADYWANGFDWRKEETKLNAHPQFTTVIDGQTIHFQHIKSKEQAAFPLILTHGWPSSFIEYRDVIGPLSDPRAHGLDPAIAFDLVIPSLPGFAFSMPLSSEGWEASRTAQAWDVLMKRLGYDRYGAQGGDGGSLVGRELGILNPEGLVGTLVQQIFAFPTGAPGEMEGLSPFEQEGFKVFEFFLKNNGYADIQAKRPLTLAFGLADSPVAQLAWNSELFVGFDGSGAGTIDRDRHLTNASLYWFTGTGGTAAEFFHENGKTGAGYRDLPNETPTGVTSFPIDFRSVRKFAERANNIVYWKEMPRGTHFAAVDAPDLLVEEIRAFFSTLI
jgi:pimeloyl-ACP methyl ester carboxylesterase